MGYPEDAALGIENREAHVYQMNDCDWWCDYSPEEAKTNYIKFVGKDTAEEFGTELPLQLTDEELDKHKFQPEEPEIGILSFRQELQRRIDNKDVPSFFASTEW
jgi:hypothetical protein